MANEQLKNALRHAGLTPEEFAEIVRVNPKTVGRWLAGTTTRTPRHRATIARALDLPEHQLWPDETPSSGPARHLPAAAAGAGSDVAGTWAYDTDQTAPHPAAFITTTTEPVDYLDNGRGIAPTPSLIHALIDEASSGRRVRLMTDLPERHYELLIGHPTSISASSMPAPATRSHAPATSRSRAGKGLAWPGLVLLSTSGIQHSRPNSDHHHRPGRDRRARRVGRLIRGIDGRDRRAAPSVATRQDGPSGCSGHSGES